MNIFRVFFASLVIALFALPVFAQIGYDVMPLAELQKKADTGDVHALNEFVFRYCYGLQGTVEDKVKATEFAKKAVKKGSFLAKGFSYEEGLGVAKDEKEALMWYRKAAEEGNAEGQCQMGLVRWDEFAGLEKDNVESVKWLRKAADQEYARAQYNLGVCYAEGKGVKQNNTEAVKWYRYAAEQGEARAQCSLGLCYANGEGIEQNDTEAVKWYRYAAEQGDDDGQALLGIAYCNGEGVSENKAESFKWFRKAAAQGNEIAIAELEKLQANQTQVRTWTSSTGNQRLRAELRSVSEDGKQITLWFQDTDEENTVMLAGFSQKDKDFVAQYQIENGIEIKEKVNEIRTWTLGKDHIEAELIEISKDGKSVTLRRNDSKEERILLEKLSENDRKFVAQYKIRKERERQEYWKTIIAQKEKNEQARAAEREERARARAEAERERRRQEAIMRQEARERWESEAPLRAMQAQLREQQKRTEALREQTKAIDKQTQTIRDLKK